MNEILLQSTVNGMSDVVFTFGNLVTIGGGVVSTLTAYFALKYGQKALEREITALNEEIVSAKRGRHAMKKEMIELIKEKDEMTRARIDKTQTEMKSYSEKTDQEFKEINNTISRVKQDTSEIKGMIQTLLNNK